MSLPLPSYDPVSRANWLGRYLAVERNFDKQLNSVLKDSLSGIDEAFAKHNRNFSDQVRRVQLSQSRRALRDVIGSIFGSTGNLIRNNRQDAAVAAIDAALFDERSIIARIFTNPVARKAYAQSLRQSGRRNIESVMTRVLETEIPLSKRVYKSQALANGMVGKTINRALARGDSFKDLARDVTALIDPAVPGGVSYAARRLGRTEINNAFHAQSIHDAQEHPWIQEMEWHLSKVHVTDPGDECELYAIQKDFNVERVPEKPHPHCRCFVTPKLPDYNDFENALVSGQYDDYLNRVLGFDEDSAAIIDMGGLGTKAGPDYGVKPISTKVVGVDSGTWQDSPNHQALVYRFQQKWMGDPLISTDNLQLVNFKPENVGLEDAKRMLAAVDDKLTKYPQAQGNLKEVVLAYGPDEEYARTIRDADGKSIIKFNLNWSRDHDAFYKHVKDNVAEGFHPANTDIDPYYDMVTHEFGHVLDNVGYHRARDEVKWISLEVHKDLNTGVRYHKWLAKGAPSHYSIAGGELGGSLNSTEALAEAFLDVERNGAAAKPLSKALAHKLIEESKGQATDVDEIMRLLEPQGFSIRAAIPKAEQAAQVASAPKAKLGRKTVDIIDVLAGDETPTSFDNYGSVEDIAHVLNDFFGIQMDFEGDFPYAWTDETTSLDAMKALGNQYLSLHNDFPHIDIQRLDNVDMIDGGIVATTYPNLTGSYMEWNRLFLQQPQILAESAMQSPDFHPAGDDENPIGHSFTHEFGHAIVNFTNSYQPDNLTFMDIHRELFNGYKAELETTGKKDTPTGFRRWMHKNLSGYSFEIDPYSQKITDVLEPDEAMAEAFGDVYMNGKDKALKGSRIIYDYMMHWHDEAFKDMMKRRARR